MKLTEKKSQTQDYITCIAPDLLCLLFYQTYLHYIISTTNLMLILVGIFTAFAFEFLRAFF